MMLMYIIEVEKKNDNMDLDGASKHVEEAIKSLAGIKHLSNVYKELVKNTISDVLFKDDKEEEK